MLLFMPCTKNGAKQERRVPLWRSKLCRGEVPGRGTRPWIQSACSEDPQWVRRSQGVELWGRPREDGWRTSRVFFRGGWLSVSLSICLSLFPWSGGCLLVCLCFLGWVDISLFVYMSLSLLLWPNECPLVLWLCVCLYSFCLCISVKILVSVPLFTCLFISIYIDRHI